MADENESPGSAEYWLKQLEREAKKFGKWRKRADKVIKRYRDERDNTGTHKFNLLWSNVETLKPAVFSRKPTPDIRRRFIGDDPIAKEAGEVIEKVLGFSMDDYDFERTLENARDDGLIAGRGQVKVCYEIEEVQRTLEPAPPPPPVDPMMGSMNGGLPPEIPAMGGGLSPMVNAGGMGQPFPPPAFGEQMGSGMPPQPQMGPMGGLQADPASQMASMGPMPPQMAPMGMAPDMGNAAPVMPPFGLASPPALATGGAEIQAPPAQPTTPAPQWLLDGAPVEPDGFDKKTGQPYAIEVVDERVYCENFLWSDYIQAPVPQWLKVPWVAFAHHMTKRDLKKNFGQLGGEVKLVDADYDTDTSKRNKASEQQPDTATVWEIWDKPSQKIYWVSPGHKDLLKEAPPPFNLKGFFPCPEPFIPIRTTDNPVPIPEYTLYQDQCEEIDKLTDRIMKLIEAIKARGGYPDVLKGLGSLLDADETALVPIENWQSFNKLGNLEKAIIWVPVEQLAKVVQILAERREASKLEVYETTGMSDILRGASKAQETATAQRLKGNFGSLRMQPRQKPFERFARDIIRLKAEIVAENFNEQTLAKIVGKPVSPEAIQMMRDDKLRSFRIDVESDSTVQPDADADKQSVIEFVTAVTEFLKTAGEVGAAAPMFMPLMMAMLKSAVRRFKVGREVEDVIDQIEQQMKQQAEMAAQQPPPEPPPDPAVIKAEAEKEKIGAQVQGIQAKAQAEGMKAQQDMAMRQMKSDQDAMLGQQKAAMTLDAHGQQQQIAAQRAMQPRVN